MSFILLQLFFCLQNLTQILIFVLVFRCFLSYVESCRVIIGKFFQKYLDFLKIM